MERENESEKAVVQDGLADLSWPRRNYLNSEKVVVFRCIVALHNKYAGAVSTFSYTM